MSCHKCDGRFFIILIWQFHLQIRHYEIPFSKIAKISIFSERYLLDIIFQSQHILFILFVYMTCSTFVLLSFAFFHAISDQYNVKESTVHRIKSVFCLLTLPILSYTIQFHDPEMMGWENPPIRKTFLNENHRISWSWFWTHISNRESVVYNERCDGG